MFSFRNLIYKDRTVPKIDYAIWLNLETCPSELNRILSICVYSKDQISTGNHPGDVPYGETLGWFNPTNLGCTAVVYEYSSGNQKNIQTLWTNTEGTRVFVRDIFD